MSRALTLIIAIFVVVAAYLLIRNHENNSVSQEQPTTSQKTSEESKISQFHDWREFSFKPEHFKILLPALPQHVTDNVDDVKSGTMVKYETFAAAGNNGAAFMVNAVSFPEGAELNEESFKTLVNDMINRKKENKLIQMKSGSFHKAPALDFSFQNEDLLVEGKIFARKNTAYILSMINNKNVFNRKEMEFFFNSFDFVDEQ